LGCERDLAASLARGIERQNGPLSAGVESFVAVRKDDPFTRGKDGELSFLPYR
jgi:hypothetical protein